MDARTRKQQQLIEEPSDEEEADVNAPETKDTPQPVKKGGSRKATTEKE